MFRFKDEGPKVKKDAIPVKQGTITTFGISMMTCACVLSLRGLPVMAKEELTMFFYIGFSTLLFLIPVSLVSAELGGALETDQVVFILGLEKHLIRKQVLLPYGWNGHRQ